MRKDDPGVDGRRVRYPAGEPTGLAELIGRLLEANLAAHPRRGRLLRGGTVVVAARDADAAVTLRMGRGRIEVEPDATGAAEVRITGDAAVLAELVGTPLLLGLPHPGRPRGRAVIRRLARGEIRIEGLLRHPLTATRVARLLSVG